MRSAERASPLARCGGAIAIVLVGAGITAALSGIDIENGRVAVMTTAVLLAAVWGGFRGGILATALTLALAEFILFESGFHFDVAAEEVVSFITLGVGAISGAMLSHAIVQSRVRAMDLADQRQQLLTAVLENQERLRSLANAMPVLVTRANADGETTYVNKQVLQYTGMEAEDLSGDGWLRIIHPDDFEASLASWRWCTQHGAATSFEQRLQRQDGEYRWHLAFIEPVRDSAGRIEHWIGANVDVHDLKMAQQRLEVSERRWRSLAEGLPLMVMETDASGDGVYVSPSFVAYSGLSEQELKRDVLQIAHPEDVEDARRRAAEAISERRGGAHEWRARRHDGQYRWHLGILSPIKRADGDVESWVVALVDVHDSKMAQEAIQLSEQRWQSLAEGLPALVAEADASGKMIYFSPSMLAYTGKTREELQGDPFSIAHAEDRESALQAYRAALRNQAPTSYEWRVRRQDGEYRWHIGYLSPARNPDGSIAAWVGALVDIHDRRVAERELRFHNALLEAEQQAAADGILVVDDDGKMLSFNERFIEMWGIPDEVVASRSDERALAAVRDKLVNPDEFIERIRYLYEHADEVSRDEIHLNDGRTFERYSAPVRNAGVHFGRIWWFRDVTGARRTEQALRESEHRYREIFNTAGVAIFEADFSEVKKDIEALRRAGVKDFRSYFERHPDFVAVALERVRLIAANEHAVKMFSAEASEDLLARFTESLEPDGIDVFRTTLLAIAEGWAMLSTEVPLRTLNGERIHALMQLTLPSPKAAFDRIVLTLVDVTSRRRIEAALRESEQRYRSLTESAPTFIFHANAAGDIVYSSPGYFEYTGSLPEDIYGNAWRTRGIIHPDDLPEVVRQWEQSLATGATFEMEHRIRGADGVYRWHLTRVVPMRDETARITGWSGTSTSIHERKLAEDRERLLATVTACLGGANTLEEIVKSITDVLVPRFADVATLTGLAADGGIERITLSATDPSIVDVASEEVSDHVSFGAGAVLRSGSPQFYPQVPDALIEALVVNPAQLEAVRALKVRSLMLVPIFVLGDTAGCLGFAAVEPRAPYTQEDFALAQEISRRVGLAIENATLLAETQRAAAELQSSRDFLRSVTNAMPALISYVNRDMRYSFTNDAYEGWFGVPAESLRGRHIREVVGEKAFAVLQPRIERALAGERLEFEELSPLPSGERWVRATYVPDVGPDGDVRGFYGLIVDITERKRIEEELRTANAAKDEFLGLVSHELKTPITTIMGNAEVLSRRAKLLNDAARGEALSDIQLEAQRLHQIIENLLTLARLEQGREVEMEPILIVRLVEKLAQDHRARHPHREIRVIAKEPHLPVVAAEVYAEQVLRNLLSNAEKYSPREGAIEVHVERRPEGISVSVLDRGVGVPEEDRMRIFDPFYRSSATGSIAGVGIGLAVCKRLVEVQGGDIVCEARDGGGSCFRVILPAYVDEDA